MAKVDEILRQTADRFWSMAFQRKMKRCSAVWEDGTPAHTIKTFGVVNRYNLQEEFPLMTLRYTN